MQRDLKVPYLIVLLAALPPGCRRPDIPPTGAHSPAPIPEAGAAALLQTDKAADGTAADTPAGHLAIDPQRWADDLIAVVVDDGAGFPVPIGAAPGRFRRLGEMTTEQPIPDALIMAGTHPRVRRFEVLYRKDESGGWTYSQATFFVTDPSGAATPTYKTLAAQLRAKLGRPTWTRRQKGLLPTTAWKLNKTIEAVLSNVNSTIPNDHQATDHVELGVGAPEGEPD